jgi:hypothetical protein
VWKDRIQYGLRDCKESAIGYANRVGAVHRRASLVANHASTAHISEVFLLQSDQKPDCHHRCTVFCTRRYICLHDQRRLGSIKGVLNLDRRRIAWVEEQDQDQAAYRGQTPPAGPLHHLKPKSANNLAISIRKSLSAR